MMTSHGCPKDSTPLTGNTIEGHNVYLCNSCSGLWLPAKVVAAAVGRIPTSNSTRSEALVCPDDNALLIPVRHHDIVIDLCSKCGGVWLDYGELEHILQRKKQGSSGSSGPRHVATGAADALVDVGSIVADAGTSGAVEAFSTVFEFVGDFFSGL